MIFVAFATLVIFLLVFKYSRRDVSSRLPPGPNIWQLLRNISFFINHPHIAVTNLAKTYGPLISFRVGGQFIVVASSPSTAKKIFESQLFTGRYFPAVFYNVPGSTDASVIMAKDCEGVWKHIRAIQKDRIHSPKAVEVNSTHRNARVQEMISYLRVRAKQGQIVNVDEAVSQVVVNTSSNYLASRNLIELDNMGRIDENFASLLEKLSLQVSKIGLSDMYPILKHVDFWSKRDSVELLETIRHIWGNTIEERRLLNHHGDPKDFLDVALDDEHSYSNDQIGFLLTESLIAATFSTSWTISWLLIELLKNEDILSRVRSEIEKEAIEGGSLHESRLPNCKYFNACIKESLRRHNPGPFGLPRRAIETCKVNDYVVPKDSIVMVNLWAIHLDPQNWVDPMTFKPDRFLNTKDNVRGTGFDFMPFSTGKRMCPGIHSATRNIQVVVASLVYFFDWRLPDGVQASDLGANIVYAALAFKKEEPLRLIPKERKDMHIVV